MSDNIINDQYTKAFSVSEISNKIRDLLEENFFHVSVKGEISNFKIASSGHGYFYLKDSTSILACTCWRSTLEKIKFPLAEGMEIIASGRLTNYAGNSRYQLSVNNLHPAGIGAMMQILNERKKRLEKEGLFSKNRIPIPFMSQIVGIVTSITGAVIRDIIHRITDRCPTRIIIWPVSVQGEGAAAEIADAIEGFNTLDINNKPNVIIVARGGGSVEDLWTFNDEAVVRATFNSKIPVISAIGHEVDYTLIDYAADRRAPTPTAAAEFVAPVLSNLKYTLRSHEQVLLNRINQLVGHQQQILLKHSKFRDHIDHYINQAQQVIDEIGFSLLESLPRLMVLKEGQLKIFTIARMNPTKIITYKSLKLSHQADYIIKTINNTWKNFQHKLKLNEVLLESLNYHNVLKRGFTLITNHRGRFISSHDDAINQQTLNIQFFDGNIKVTRINE